MNEDDLSWENEWAATKRSFSKLREHYSKLDGADRVLFWVHFVVAPLIIFASLCLGFGWPAALGCFGLLLWKASDA